MIHSSAGRWLLDVRYCTPAAPGSGTTHADDALSCGRGAPGPAPARVHVPGGPCARRTFGRAGARLATREALVLPVRTADGREVLVQAGAPTSNGGVIRVPVDGSGASSARLD